MLELDAVRAPVPVARRRRTDSTASILGAVGAAVGLAGSWIPSYWGDEAASVLSAGRTWPGLAALLANVDGVHGVYYALLHVWIRIFGTSELATRALSAIAVGFLVAGTYELARGFVGPRIALWAGILCIFLPRTTFMATETRSYALGAAVAVWTTVLFATLLRRVAGGEAPRWRWLAYAAAMAGSMYLFLYLGLLLLVHGAAVAVIRRSALRRWAGAAVASLVLASPIIYLGYRERTQITFLQRRHYATVGHVLVSQWFGYPLLAVVGWLLIGCALAWLTVGLLRRHRPADVGRVSLSVLTGLWVVLPTTVLLVVNATVEPTYNVRYLSFCAPAVAILMALGIRALTEGIARPRRALAVAALVAAVVLVSTPVYVGQRTPYAKDGGSDLRAVAAYIGASASPGGAIVFDQTTKPSRDPRLALDLYPASFAGLHDVALEAPYTARARLWDRTSPADVAAARAARYTDVWAIELTKTATPVDVVLLQDLGYRIASTQLIHRTTVFHLVRN